MPERTSKKNSKKVASNKAPAKKKPARRKSSKKAAQEKAPDTCFVMMPFGDPFELHYADVYRPAIEAACLAPVRADDLFRPSAIVADLWKMIQEAKVMLAELTTKNANVFYELGLAHAIGKPVVLVSETMADVPFDLQQLRVISYNQADPKWGDKLTGKVTAALTETLVTPVEAVPSIFRTVVQSQGPQQDATEARLESLEREMRLLRADSVPRLDSVQSTIMRREARRIESEEAFYDWVRRWAQRGVNVDTLERAARIAQVSSRFRPLLSTIFRHIELEP